MYENNVRTMSLAPEIRLPIHAPFNQTVTACDDE